MTHDELLEMWTIDSEIDSNHLDSASIQSGILHGKYLKILVDAKIKLVSYQNQYNVMRQDKFRYYRGEMSREELMERNWNQWQYAKPLKAEMDEHLLGDNDLNKIKMKIEYLRILVDAVESIIKTINGQQWTIRNAIEFKKFQAGQ